MKLEYSLRKWQRVSAQADVIEKQNKQTKNSPSNESQGNKVQLEQILKHL